MEDHADDLKQFIEATRESTAGQEDAPKYPKGYDFESINEFVHGDVHFEELQSALLGMASHFERLFTPAEAGRETAGRKYREALWEGVHAYTRACGGNPDRFGGHGREKAVVAVERSVDDEISALKAELAEVRRSSGKAYEALKWHKEYGALGPVGERLNNEAIAALQNLQPGEGR